MTASITLANTTLSIESKSLNWSKIWEMAEFNRYAIISMSLLVVGCLGGVSAAYTYDLQLIALAGIAFSSMTVLTLIMAVQPMKWIISAAAVAVTIDLIVCLNHFMG